MFGFLLWLAVAVPSLVGTALYVKLHLGFVVGLLLDSLVGLAIVSCALRMGKWVAVATCNHPKPERCLQTGMFSRQAAPYLREVQSGKRLIDVVHTNPRLRR